jgi:signal peptidase I
MSHRSHILGYALAAAALLTAGLLWLALAPTRLGGSVDYATTYGISMKPKLHRGDVAVLTPQSTYRVGEVVGYHNKQLQRTVLHRIVGRDGDRYVFKGDNNSSPDSYEPTRGELIGRMWFHVPFVGKVFAWLRVPSHAGLSGGFATIPLLLFGGAGATSRRRRGKPPLRKLRPPSALAGLLGPALFALVGFCALGAAALNHTATHLVDVPGAYVQQGEYHYSGRAPQGDVYPSSAVTTGQAVFSALVHDVDMGFTYRFVSAQPHGMHGVASLDITLGSSLGWTRSLPSVVNRTFNGDTVELTRLIDLRSINATLDRYLKETGVSSDSFTITLVPHVHVHGLLAGKRLASDFDPTPLTFIVDHASLRLAHPELGSSSFGQSADDQLHPSLPGSMPRPTPSRLRILLFNPLVTTVRRDALLGAIGAFCLALLAGAALATARSGGELSMARRRYGHLLVPVTRAPEGARVFVERLDGLAQIATNYATVILHLHEDAGDSFFAVGEGSVYCHVVPRG